MPFLLRKTAMSPPSATSTIRATVTRMQVTVPSAGKNKNNQSKGTDDIHYSVHFIALYADVRLFVFLQ